MSTVTQLQTQIATYLGRNTVSDLVINGQDIGLFALNSARRKAEQAHDFVYSETNLFLPIGATGAPITNAVANTTLTVAGTLSPNIVGTFTIAGYYNGLPYFTATVSATLYYIWNNGSAWAITTNGFAIGSNYWILTTTSTNPSGSYTAHGSNTGTPVVTNGSSSVTIKRIKYISLPLNSGDYQPIELLTSDQYQSRARMEIGRQNFNPTMSLHTLGVSFLGNPLAYQNGQTIYLAPSSLSFPITAQLSVVQFLPDYTTGSNTDFFTTYGPEYLYWQGVIEANNYYKRFTETRIEGQVSTDHVQQLADTALAAFIAWDASTVKGTSTPMSQSDQQSVPAPPQAA